MMLKLKQEKVKLSALKQLRLEKEKAITRKLLLSGTIN